MRTLRIPVTGPLVAASTLGVVVFLACLFGIYTRPIGLLAAVWPANALLLGLLVLNPKLATGSGYLGAVIAYILADLITGASLLSTLLLTAANVMGVSVGHLLFQLIDHDDQRLRRPHSALYLLLIAAGAALASGIFGGIISPLLFNDEVLSSGIFWFTTELIGYIAILPVLLSAPENLWGQCRQLWYNRRSRPDVLTALANRVKGAMPAAALLLSCTAAHLIGGPGAVAFPVPALLWCALVYGQWVTAIFALMFSFWILLAITSGHAATIDFNERPNLLSLRIGIALIALGPMMVASVMAARGELVRRLEHLATHDHLTELLNQRAFRELSTSLLARLAVEQAPVAVLMLDIDNFKKINDTDGHLEGDHVLATFAALIHKSVRETDLAARLGGEEFSILIPQCRSEETAMIAECICKAFADTEIWSKDGTRISVTVSIGAAFAEHAPTELTGLLATADLALYRAKAAGRNRVELSWPVAADNTPSPCQTGVASAARVCRPTADHIFRTRP